MDVEKELLLHDLDRYGYSLAQPTVADPASVLTRMFNSKDSRVLEGVPVVLTHMLVHGQQLDLKGLEQTLPVALQRRLRVLAAVTYYFMFWVPHSEVARKRLLDYLTLREPALLEQVQHKLHEKQALNVGMGTSLDAERLENTYKNYVVNQLMEKQESVSKKLDDERQSAFLLALSELFTERQRDLLFKFLKKQELTKTEREYLSRTVKPRLKALRNADVQSLATTLLGF
jgi:hypothetical protein